MARALVVLGLASAAVSVIVALGVAAQPAAPARPPQPLNVVANFARVDKANVGGGDCGVNGILQSDRGPLNTATYLVECVHRTSAGSYPPEVHPGQDQVYYIMKGEATLIYGGKVVDKEIVGGTSIHLSAGDVTVLPADQPDQWKIPNEISFLLFRRKP
jgi:mannose-6-phosphate isomerase-like protein (cupin superfamily)